METCWYVYPSPTSAQARCQRKAINGHYCRAHQLPHQPQVVHYGTLNGPACGSRFSHEGLTARWDVILVTCKRCKKTAEFKADGGTQ